jgi:outer membrane protein assembly factor BamB
LRLKLAVLLSLIPLLGLSACPTGHPPVTAPEITMQPANQTVTAPATATFSVTATGTDPLTYTWESAPSGSAAFAAISGAANSSSYTTSATSAGQSGTQFRVVVSNGASPAATSNAATLTVNAPAGTAPSITAQPTNQTVTAGGTATFTVTATGTAPLSYQWQSAPSGSSTYTNVGSASATPSLAVTNTTVGMSGSTFRVVVSNGVNPAATSNAATLTVNAVTPSGVTVLTYHNDAGRTGQNLTETTLTTSNVNSTNFGLLGSISVDGPVDAEPLYVGNLTLQGGTHNTLFVVTENDSVYAFDADSFTQLWKKSVVGSNETPSNEVDNCDQVTPSIGITSTPVIDLSAGPNGTIFVVGMTKNSSGTYFQRLHALDITTGAERTDITSPTTIQATYSGQTFNPEDYEERVGLLLVNGGIYLGWTSHCDVGSYQAWVMGYSESNLQQTSAIDLTPNGNGGGIWQAGDGLAADSSGYIYFLDGNGSFDSTQGALQANGDYGNAFIKLSTGGGTLAVADFFATFDTVQNSNQDLDLGSGGALVLPDIKDNSGTTWHLAIGAGKHDVNSGEPVIFLVNRDAMGKFNASNDNAIYQELTSALEGNTGVFAMPAYFNSTVFYGAVDDNLKAFSIVNAKLVSPAGSASSASFEYPGTTPSVSANGSSNAIIWAVENASGGVLHAYDATNLSNELYNSNQAGARDNFQDNKFITPMIANGKVYVGTPNSVAVFGLFPSSAKLLRKSHAAHPRQNPLPARVAPHPGSSTPGY